MENVVTARAAILLVLVEGPAHGAAISERVTAQSLGKVSLGDGSLYPTLKALEKEKLLKALPLKPARGKEGKTGGRPRCMYALTASGKTVATATAQTLRAMVGQAGQSSETERLVVVPVSYPAPDHPMPGDFEARTAATPRLFEPEAAEEAPAPTRVVEMDADVPVEVTMDQRHQRGRRK